MTLEEAYKMVYEDLVSDNAPNLFRGVYDAKHGSEKFMYGVLTVMEHIAYKVSEGVGDSYGELAIKNLVKSKERLENE